MSVSDEVEALIDGLGTLDAHSLVLAAAARALAGEVTGAIGVIRQTSAAGAVRELRATLAELTVRCRAGATDDEGWDFGTGPDLAPVRDAEGLQQADVRG